MLESISKALQKLQKEKTVLSNKLIKIAEVCKNKFLEVQLEQAEKHANHEARFESINKDIENLKRDENKLSSDLFNLEAERTNLDNQILVIDKALKEIKEQIDKEHIDDDSDDIENDTNDDSSRKQCKFDRKGYCRQTNNCPFLHADKICEIYTRNGVCWKLNCNQRHPKLCWYGSRCFRRKILQIFTP